MVVSPSRGDLDAAGHRNHAASGEGLPGRCRDRAGSGGGAAGEPKVAPADGLPRRPPTIVLLAFDGINLLDIAGPLQAFEAAELRRDRRTRYRTIVASVDGGAVQTSAGLPIVTEPLAAIDPAAVDTVIVGGGSVGGRPLAPPGLVRWIAAHEAGFRRTCSICAGAFVLAAAGLLAGRRATTHWHWAPLLREENPAAIVEPDALYVNDGAIWTSAGVTAGIDLTLALIEQDWGYAVAIEAARRLVVFMKRPGGQAQFSVPLLLQSRGDGSFATLHAWMRQNLAGDLSVARLAAETGMSERSFARSYADQVGRTPAKAVEAMRTEAACDLLAATSLPVKRIADVAGFGDEQNLRRVFLRRFGLNPIDYRRRFGAAVADSRPAGGEGAAGIDGHMSFPPPAVPGKRRAAQPQGRDRP